MTAVEQLKIAFDTHYTHFDDREANLLLQLIDLITQNKYPERVPNDETLSALQEANNRNTRKFNSVQEMHEVFTHEIND